MRKLTWFLFFLVFVFSMVVLPASAQTPWWRLNTAADLVAQLSKEREENLRLPVLMGIAPGSFKGNYGTVYSSGSVHQGQDIFAPRGAYVVSPTLAVVTRIDFAGAGGIAVYTANPGDETFYYAHLTAIGPTITLGAKLEMGDLIGYVGNTGDAEGSSTHLHFQIFSLDGPINPNPRLTKEFSSNERIIALGKIIDRSDNPPLAAKSIVALYKNFFLSLPSDHIALHKEIILVLNADGTPIAIPSVPAQETVVSVAQPVAASSTTVISGTVITQSLRVGMNGDEVKKLQQYLIDKKTGQYAEILKGYGPTGTFGRLTQAALIEFQKAQNINPAVGFCGPLTRAYIASHS